jgi:hypothetical protein
LPQIDNRLTFFRCAVRAAGAMQQAADLGRSHGGVMHIGRNVIISIIVVFGVAGSIDANVTVSAKLAQARRVPTWCQGRPVSTLSPISAGELTYCATTACRRFAESAAGRSRENPSPGKLAAAGPRHPPDPIAAADRARNSRRSSLPAPPSPYCCPAVAIPSIFPRSPSQARTMRLPARSRPPAYAPPRPARIARGYVPPSGSHPARRLHGRRPELGPICLGR